MKIKTNSRLYNIYIILYKTLLEYFSTTVYLLSVISVIDVPGGHYLANVRGTALQAGV